MADEQIMTTEDTIQPQMFEIITAEEASRRMRSVRLEAALEQYRKHIEAGVAAVQQGKRFHVRLPSQHEAEAQALKVAIKRVAKGTPFNMDVRFDRAQEGFIVRQAAAQEKQRGIERGKALTAARDRQKEQLKIAQSIMAQPVSPEGVETGDNPFLDKPLAEQGARKRRRQEQALSPGAEEGVVDAAQTRETATVESAAASGTPPTAQRQRTPGRKRR